MNTITFNKYYLTCIIASLFLVYGIGSSSSSYAKVLLVVLALTWMGFVFWIDREIVLGIFRVHSVIYYCIFLTFFLVGVLFGKNYVLGLKYFGTFVLYLIIIFMYEFYSRLENKKYLKIISNITLWGCMYFVIIALIFYAINPGAGRNLATNTDYYGTIMIGGGYQLAYLAAIIISYLLLRPTLRNILVCIVLGILLLKTQSTITMLIAATGVFISLLIVYLKKLSPHNRVVFIGIILLIMIFFYMLRGDIGDILLKVTNSEYSEVAERIQDIGHLLKGHSLTDKSPTMLRMAVYKNSLDVIKSNPIFGEMFVYGVVPLYGSASGNTGGHSDLLDPISRWGMIFGGVFLAAFFSEIRKIKRILINGWSVIIVLILLLFFNPTIGFSFCAGVFFMVPAMEQVELSKKNR